MDKYIKQLLERYSKIILPKFGAIVIEDEETGELMFNEYLSYDDGKLSELLVKESNMDIQEAQNMVAKFVRDLQAQLSKGETYSIFQLGEFSKNDDGEFIFTGNLKTGGIQSDVAGPSPSPAAPKEPTPVATPPSPKKEKVEPTKSAEDKPESKSNDQPKKNVYVEKKALDSEIKKEAIKETPPVKSKKQEKVAAPVKTKSSKKEKKKEKKKRKPVFWIIIILLLLIAASSVLVGLNYDKVEEYMGWNKFDAVEKVAESDSEIVLPEEQLTDDTENDSPETIIDEESLNSGQEDDEIQGDPSDDLTEDVVEEPVKKEPSPTPVAQASTGSHHIIVGCFSDLSNAEGLASEFKQHGFDSKIIGQFGGLHFVAAQSYSSYSEAKANLSRVNEIRSGAWLFKK